MESQMEQEEAIFTIITGAGEARAKVFEAITLAEAGQIEQAKSRYVEAEHELAAAHKIQTAFIQQECNGEPVAINMLFVHAQDHLMTAMSEKGLAEKIITVYGKMGQLEQRLLALEQKL